MIKLITLTKKLHWPGVFLRDASSFLAFNIPCKHQSFPKLSIKAWNNNKKTRNKGDSSRFDNLTDMSLSHTGHIYYNPQNTPLPKIRFKIGEIARSWNKYLACIKWDQKVIKIYWYKTVGLSEEVWVPVAPASANSLIWVHHLPASLIPDQRTSKEDEARCSDSLQGISRNICSPCIAHLSELRSTRYHLYCLCYPYILHQSRISVNCGTI